MRNCQESAKRNAAKISTDQPVQSVDVCMKRREATRRGLRSPTWESRDGVKRGRKNQEVMHKLWKVDCVSLGRSFIERRRESLWKSRGCLLILMMCSCLTPGLLCVYERCVALAGGKAHQLVF